MYRRIIEGFDILIEKHQNTLLNGRIKDFTEYRQVIGRIQGIAEARDMFINITEQGNKDA